MAPDSKGIALYVSPYGKPRGLVSRLGYWAGRMAGDVSLPWAGLGILEDIRLAMQILNKREWLEAMHRSTDPEAQRFAAELLDDTDALDDVQAAADRAEALPAVLQGTAPDAVIDMLDEAALSAQRDYAAVRDVLVQTGALADDDEATPVADLLRALLS